jgi:hypothetical protein
MLTEGAIAYLQPLTFSKTARRQACFLPLGGIYWDDEIPDFPALLEMPEEDRLGIFKLFAIRFKIWGGMELEAGEKLFLEKARAKVPDYALFQRLTLSHEDRAAQEQVEKDLTEGFAAMFEAADEVSISDKDGVQSFSATFDLTKAKEPWWKRIFRR